MGTQIYRIMHQRGHALAAGFDAPQSMFFGRDAASIIGQPQCGIAVGDISADALRGAEVVIDFSAPAATSRVLQAAVDSGTGIVIGTTGLDENLRRAIAVASEKIPVVFSPNMSVGVAALFKLVEEAARILSVGYDVEVFEAHHKLKKDSPSGTARRLIDIVKETNPALRDAHGAHGREGLVGERPANEIGVQVLRGGDIVGEHTVFFVGTGERIELTHRATSRENFAEGAVRAAEYLAGRAPGLYTMNDVLGL